MIKVNVYIRSFVMQEYTHSFCEYAVSSRRYLILLPQNEAHYKTSFFINQKHPKKKIYKKRKSPVYILYTVRQKCHWYKLVVLYFSKNTLK